MGKAKLRGLESLEALRASLPLGPEEKPVVGVVVPAPGNGEGDAEILRKNTKVIIEALGPKKMIEEAVIPSDSMRKLAVIALMGKTLSTAIDEGQVVGELLEWLELKGHIQKYTRAQLQQQFFEERDR
jgi:hypothetical protein